MSQKEQIQPINSTPDTVSELERFTLGFEYDKTIQEVRRDTRTRAI